MLAFFCWLVPVLITIKGVEARTRSKVYKLSEPVTLAVVRQVSLSVESCLATVFCGKGFMSVLLNEWLRFFWLSNILIERIAWGLIKLFCVN